MHSNINKFSKNGGRIARQQRKKYVKMWNHNRIVEITKPKRSE